MAPFAVQRHRSEMGGDFPFASTAATGPESDAPPPLDPETVEHFCREGWLVARGFLSAERAAELVRAAHAVDEDSVGVSHIGNNDQLSVIFSVIDIANSTCFNDVSNTLQYKTSQKVTKCDDLPFEYVTLY